MTNEQPASGNATGLPALLSHISGVQNEVMHLQSLLETLDFIDNEDACHGARTSIITLATRLASEINNSLDSVNLPAVEAAQ